ncbi:MAG: carbamoyl-phosphate synthase large subunit [Polyangiaceae bacterium]|nr:carbamoyl-phosphate synthase large subunit [Polyangiaceae bacterium]MCE7892937.1 carbamoyl-phosphate synthase large subunit [Sorangiineae bacterium PRO1]
MPKREDIEKILLIGSGPIVIGQACEFDYSGTQGAKALTALGYDVVLVNSNPATIMTDPELVRRTYVEPLELETLTAIIERERPDALLPTLGGQTALNLALALHENGILSRNGVKLLGAQIEAIRKAEDRQLFKEAMARAGLECPRSTHAESVAEARGFAELTGYPVILRPSFTLGGSGGAIVRDAGELEAKVEWALQQSPTHQVLVEESVLGWKEYELEVIRDKADNFIVVCSIENLDPMGVHTGDSITVAPAMTLTDREYQRLRDAARAVMHEIGVETGGSNVQFAVDPKTGRVLVIEMNPRVSRSSALASKATGYPIAKIAAKLAVGFTLDELQNDITGTSAAFEPTIDYVVVKWPRFAFEKFPGSDNRLGPQMKSVGEAMSIGRTFAEALQKAARSLETGKDGLTSLVGRVDYRALLEDPTAARDLVHDAPPMARPRASAPPPRDELGALLEKIVTQPTAERLFHVADAIRQGISLERLHELTAIDPWFLRQMARIVAEEQTLASAHELSRELLRQSKRLGFSDAQIARLRGVTEADVRAAREAAGVHAVYGRVDTCAAEFVAKTPYLYSTWETESEAEVSDRKKVVILGGGPNRIGQGIEFDYCCCHAVFALRELGIETVMVNCNPETVSTDYDTSDRLYFEPLTLEDVLSICREEASRGELLGVIVQFGGQTPLKLAVPLERAGVRLLGTSADAIDRAEDRERFDELLSKLGLLRPKAGIAKGAAEAKRIASEIGYPVLVRPSYVLGGRAMMICWGETELDAYVELAIDAAREEGGSQILLIDQFLKNAVEVDVDCVSDGRDAVIGGVMQHIEAAGIHSGDSTSVLPPYSLEPAVIAEIERNTRALALELGVVGLMNVQFAVKDGVVYVLEVNPRASRTVPFVSKSTGRPLAKLAAKVMVGKTLAELGIEDEPVPTHVAVKESVFPFAKFPGVDTILGPEMRSTGEVMGISISLPLAFGKSMAASGYALPDRGRAFISVQDDDKAAACDVARRLRNLGFSIVATGGTAQALEAARIPAERINKVLDGSPHVVDAIEAGSIQVVVNTSQGAKAIRDSYSIRRTTLLANIPYFTTLSAARAAVDAMEVRFVAGRNISAVRSLQEWHQRARRAAG